MLIRKLVFTALILCSGFSAAETESPIVVVGGYSQTFTRGTFPRKGIWYGLYCKDMDCQIIKAPVRITSSAAENVIGEKELIDVLNINGMPLALFYGVPLKPGKVTTWFSTTNFNLKNESDHHIKLEELGSWHMPWGSKPLTVLWVKLLENPGFSFQISDGTITQFMFTTPDEGHYGESYTPFIQWIGDLDGDGKIDLLLSVPGESCGYDYRLYLSSLAIASDGELLHEAAQISGGLAACGC